MFNHPIARFAAGALLGIIASFSISLGLLTAVAAVAAVALFAVAWKSHAAAAGGLMGIGLAWVVFAALSFSRTLNNGPGSGDGESFLPFLAAAGLIFLTGVAVGLLGIIRVRAKKGTPWQ